MPRVSARQSHFEFAAALGSGEETTYDITFPNYHTGGCVWKDANGEEFMTENEMGAICSLAVGSAFCN